MERVQVSIRIECSVKEEFLLIKTEKPSHLPAIVFIKTAPAKRLLVLYFKKISNLHSKGIANPLKFKP